MNRITACLLVAALLSAAGPCPARATTTGPAWGTCPVTPPEWARAEHSAAYQGRTVRFCCAECREMFLRDPGRYAAALRPAPVDAATAPSPPPLPFEKRAWAWVDRWTRAVARWQPYLAVAGIAVLAHLVARRAAARARPAAEAGQPLAGWRGRLVAAPGRRSSLVVVLLAVGVTGYVAGLSEEEPGPAVRVARQLAAAALEQGPELGAALRSTYYRGNDDRGPTLFRGGVYRTCSFHLSLATAGGEPVSPGDAVAGRPLFVRLEIERAPHAMASHFRDPDMAKIVLVRRTAEPWLGMPPPSDGPADVHFSVLQPGERWAAEHRVGTPSASGTAAIGGVLFLCPSRQPLRDVCEDAHYAVRYVLDVRDGRLLPSSRLWMAAVVVPNEFLPDRQREWFSHLPIEVLPGPQTQPAGTDDAAVAGKPGGTGRPVLD